MGACMTIRRASFPSITACRSPLIKLVIFPNTFFVSNFGLVAAADASVEGTTGAKGFVYALFLRFAEEASWEVLLDKSPCRVASKEWTSDCVFECEDCGIVSVESVISPISISAVSLVVVPEAEAEGSDNSLADVSAFTLILRACSRITSVRIASAWTAWRLCKTKTYQFHPRLTKRQIAHGNEHVAFKCHRLEHWKNKKPGYPDCRFDRGIHIFVFNVPIGYSLQERDWYEGIPTLEDF